MQITYIDGPSLTGVKCRFGDREWVYEDNIPIEPKGYGLALQRQYDEWIASHSQLEGH